MKMQLSSYLLFAIAIVFVVSFLNACTKSEEQVVLERFSHEIGKAITKGVDEFGKSRVVVDLPPSLMGGVLCVAGPYALSSRDSGLLDLVGEIVPRAEGEVEVRKMRDATYGNSRHLYHIDAEGKAVWTKVDWPVFIGEFYKLRLVEGDVLVLSLNGTGLTGIDLE